MDGGGGAWEVVPATWRGSRGEAGRLVLCVSRRVRASEHRLRTGRL